MNIRHNRFLIFLFIVLLGVGQSTVNAKKLYKDRIYEPVILRGEILSAFYNIPINEIFMYAYQESTQTWNMMPFQIDEMVRARDPFKPGNDDAWQDFYFIADDGLLDGRDELIFMVRDLGDEVPDHVWIDNEDAKNHQRLEIMVCDPNDNNNSAYGYLFQSTTITDEIPSPYGFGFDPTSQIVGTKNYSVRLSKVNGLIEDVMIQPPFGSGIDIFDTQKIRFIGVFDLGIITIAIGKNGAQAANERDNLYLYNENDIDNYHLWYTPKPVVRLIREVRQTIRFGDFVMDETAFYVKTKFYPFSGTIGGGADLDPETLKRELNMEEDIYIRLELLRQSWDFNAAADGMKFFNRQNQNIVIDGMPDQVNKLVQTPMKEWTLTTGNQGSMFSHVEFEDTTWQNVELYFHDNKAGGQADETYIEGGDTGDSVSYGDQGILFHSHTDDSVSLKLDFTAYFLPQNLEKADGEKLAYWVENPVTISSWAVSYPTRVKDNHRTNALKSYMLYQNYPNPFNNSTVISFTLPSNQMVTLTIFDGNGRVVTRLVDRYFKAGVHHIQWDGTDDRNQGVASGVYFYEFYSKLYSSTKKLILLR
ncbi:MAG: T9SS type A sorting domain-containing protein [bacterium]|nr:MAG: T9SS type A sorting domain-containing protein [bacterium]